MNTWLPSARGMARGAAAALVVAAGTAAAGTLDYQINAGLGFSDNLGRQPSGDETDETIGQLGLRFAYDEDTRKLRADVTGDLAYLTYLDNSYDDELVGNLYANTAFAIIPERLTWNLSDQWGQVATDPFQPTTPDNRESINYFSTGPDLLIGMGSNYRVRLGATYSMVDYEEDPFDSTSTGGRVSLIRAISDRSSLSLNASAREVEYDEDALNADFGQTDAFLRYETAGARTNIGIDLGRSELDRDALPEAESGTLLRMDLSRRISPSTVVSLTGGREFTTAAGTFAMDQGAGIGSAPGRQTADPYTQDRAVLSWSYSRHVTALTLSAGWTKRSHDDRPELDDKLTTFTTRYRRDLSPSMSLDAAVTYSTMDYQPPLDDFDDISGELGLSWRLSRSVTVDLKYQYASRDSTTPLSDYSENRLLLTIGYGRGEPRANRNPPAFGVDSTLNPAN